MKDEIAKYMYATLQPHRRANRITRSDIERHSTRAAAATAIKSADDTAVCARRRERERACVPS